MKQSDLISCKNTPKLHETTEYAIISDHASKSLAAE